MKFLYMSQQETKGDILWKQTHISVVFKKIYVSVWSEELNFVLGCLSLNVFFFLYILVY